ncbi:MAG TPA: lysophospholipid acyltransferase family protein [Cyclobacteriaceae bacterium]|jgi:1-acyl-sn-glycerol-3-phosphate acyltransferase|nr:1-acyl-sn-glycerol-3-phosphate acyltransferase [Cytophagales bacterium]HMR57258.1 lysophospholipid acyltransferase family protein [Cyclobacteriaceae bacterium]HNT49487.1 lysophospholipid acyltransferase family protein [Cyclobacteriaceae bacterium]HRE65582.1 lysophospholipid acyltransferase family protein [Cyclobacteriaceae bacterium]HRF34582.1 lysophospholipid acyltransferase family protein [Cyclobacteriaceae bacterium]
MRVLRTIHTYYCLILFAVLFIILLPFFLIPIIFKNQFKLVGILNRWWAYIWFTLSFIPFKIECRARLNSSQQYIFCPNHFSYLDIPALGLNPHNSIFVGKNDMEHIPLFGFMYRKLHIMVNRSKLRSRMNSILLSLKAIEAGKSLVIFPEGGIVTPTPPQMAAFKDGAFRVSVEKQIPIVPVTIPNNWIILPDRNPLRVQAGCVRVIFHEPIYPNAYTLNTLEAYKKEVYQVIDKELTLCNSTKKL